jgi:peptidoglycan/xylan/chitin deacetylase (PgdA/CDA1 family)
LRRFPHLLALLVIVAAVGCDGKYALKNPFARRIADAPTTVPAPPTASASPAPRAFDPNIHTPLSPLCAGQRIPVIMYHDVIKARGRSSVYFDITRAELKAQLDWLADRGAHFLSLEQLHRHLTHGDPVPDHSVVLTFDDNYQGFFDLAYPMLKARQIPAAMFVHTNFVGDKSGAHPKMDWETLRKLDSDGLVTIGSHTLSHPEDMAKLPIEVQERELVESKARLENELGHPVPYFAYPNGTGDEQTFQAAQRAGYTMAVTIVNQPAEESPSILTVGRYIHTRLEKAWQECEDNVGSAPASVFVKTIPDSPVTLETGTYDGIRLVMVKGGKPTSHLAGSAGRKSVGEFVRDTGATAGMNGTFFANANLRSTDSALIGPARSHEDAALTPDTDRTRLTKLRNRPLVVWGPEALAIVPFNAGSMSDDNSLMELMPDVTDVFLAGAWIVHDGIARTRAQTAPFAARDFNDPRKRAFFGVTETGQVVLGASVDVITTEMLARGAAAAGIQEAVLMDSGFSTSIVFDGKIVATGHTAKNLPSRPVPHAIVVAGVLETPTDEATAALLEKADPAVGDVPAVDAEAGAPGPSDGKRRRKKRR